MATIGEVLTALPGGDDTIAAISSAVGRGATALVRVSGRGADSIAGSVVRPWPIPPRTATLCSIHDPATGALLDRALVTRLERGRSFTGEATVELSTHGGMVTPALVLAALLAAGARQALPGEFTRRAVGNGKLDLAQAEAIGDIIDATSRAGHLAALALLDGGLSRRVLELRESLLQLEALLAYDIDFPEEDDGPVAPERIDSTARTLLDRLDALLATAPAGALIRDGAVVVLAGPPNAGKSALFNALLGESRALVTPIAGTTRDAIEAVIDGPRWPLRLIDTAGLREGAESIEQLGIEVSERYLTRAHVVLVCGERDEDIVRAEEWVARHAAAPRIRVRTKCDLHPDGGSSPRARDALAVSAERGIGLTALLGAIDAALEPVGGVPEPDMPVLTHARHVAALHAAREELRQFAEAWQARALPAPVAAVHLRAAVGMLEELVGSVDIEQVLERVFRTFCVGK